LDNLESFPVLSGFIKSGGTIDLGRIDSLECAAIAADPQTVWVVLLRRKGEGLLELLDRLERRLSRCLMNGVPFDELEQQLLQEGPGTAPHKAAVAPEPPLRQARRA